MGEKKRRRGFEEGQFSPGEGEGGKEGGGGCRIFTSKREGRV